MKATWLAQLWTATVMVLVFQSARGSDCVPNCASGAGDIRQIDPYPLDASAGARTIPDLANGGTVTLSDGQLIDVVILGDGYLGDDPATSEDDSEEEEFFAEACGWYRDLFCPDTGIRPYNDFAQVFRVRAVFTESERRVSGPDDDDRQSYYKLLAQVDTNGIPTGLATVSGWWNAEGEANEEFRANLFFAIDSVEDPPVNLAKYPPNLVRPVPADDSGYFEYESDTEHQDYLPALSNRYSNLIVVMMIRMEGGASSGGAAKQILSDIDNPAQARRVMVAFGENARHEFGHAFADLFDEYIQQRAMNAMFANPDPPSVFLLWNVSFSNDRCEMLWPHLAPGARYNPNLHSPIGRLYMGGYCALNVWHSEYVCLMNGKRDSEGNYECAVSPDAASGIGLRACELCFWCQEVIAVRILEKAGQFARSSDPSDVNARGQTWYQLWDTTLRDAYYRGFDVAARIIARNAQYAASIGADKSLFGDCNNNGVAIPSCLLSCDVVEYGNAIYVESASGDPSNAGSRATPLNKLLDGIDKADAVCGTIPLISIQPGSYPGPMTLSKPTIVLTDSCDPVVIGK